MLQKFVNVVAVSSGVVSLAVVGSGLYVYVNRDALIDGVKSQAIEAITGSLGLPGGVGGIGGGSLPLGTPDLAPPAGQSPLAGENAATGGPSAFGVPNF
tara:strand:- start:896 stop:1192 length:297 start_codon:yes stop_codon:yes gene_type:complete